MAIVFKHRYKSGSLIGTGAVKFRPYTVASPLPQLATPQNVTADGTTVSWDAVENATRYAVLAGGNEIGTVEQMSNAICGNNTICSNTLLVGNESSQVSVNVASLPGWSSLSIGSHNITIVARADGYRDSEPSAAVSVEKITWENPIQVDDILTITQVYASIQSGSDLSIE